MAIRRLNPLYADQKVSNLGFPVVVEKNPDSGALSTYHGLSKQRFATTGRPGRVATPRSSHTFESALTQNTGVGLKGPDMPQPAPTVFGGGAGGGTDTASPDSPFGAVGDYAGQQAGENIGKGMIGLASKGVAQGLTMGMPIGAVPAALAIGALSPIGLANVAIGQGISAQTAAHGVSSSPSLSGTAAQSAVDAAMANSPQTAIGHLGSLIGLGPTAGEASEAAVSAAEQGMAQSVGISASSEDPTAGLYGSEEAQPALSSVVGSMLGQGGEPDVGQEASPFGSFGNSMSGLSNALDAMNAIGLYGSPTPGPSAGGEYGGAPGPAGSGSSSWGGPSSGAGMPGASGPGGSSSGGSSSGGNVGAGTGPGPYGGGQAGVSGGGGGGGK